MEANVYYYVLSQINPVHTHSYLSKMHFNIVARRPVAEVADS
jgi:hypothetical protein